MAWRIELDRAAVKELDALDPPVAKRILKFLNDRVAPLDDPRSIGEALTGARLGSLWKYRVGDYRIICSIEDGAVQILVVKIGNRREPGRVGTPCPRVGWRGTNHGLYMRRWFARVGTECPPYEKRPRVTT